MENYVVLIFGFITPICGIVTLAITIYRLQKGNQKARTEQLLAFARCNDKVLANELEISKTKERIEKAVSESKSEIARMEAENSERTRLLYSKIDLVRNEMYSKLEKAIDKTEVHQGQIMDKIEVLTGRITDMCATFNEYRKSRDEKQKAK